MAHVKEKIGEAAPEDLADDMLRADPLTHEEEEELDKKPETTRRMVLHTEIHINDARHYRRLRNQY